MNKNLRKFMLAGAAMLALGASAQTVETVWKHTTGIPGSAWGGDMRFCAALNGKIIYADKTADAQRIAYYDETNQNVTLHDLAGIGIGTAIATDEAGNILVNKGFPGATSSTDWMIIPADGSANIDLTITLPSGEGARFDQASNIVGNLLSEEGAYIWICKMGADVVDIIKIVNGAQDAEYSYASLATQTGWIDGYTTSTVVHPIPTLTVDDINNLCDTDGDPTPSFVMHNRSNAGSIYVWGEDTSTGMTTITKSGTGEGFVVSAKASNEGFQTFALQGKVYYVAHTTTDGTDAGRSSMFGIFDETGALVAHSPVADNVVTAGATINGFAVEPCDENSVYIYQWYPSKIAAKYKFSVPAATPEGPAPLATFTFVPDGTTQTTIAIMGTAAGQTVTVDWGDGTVSEPIAIGDPLVDWSAVEIKGTPAGDGVVKLYGNAEEIAELDASWATDELKMQAINVAGLTATTSLSVISHEITAIDLSKNTALTSLNLSNNKLAALNLDANTAITSLNLSNSATLGENRLGGVDLSKLTAVKTLNLSYNEIAEIEVPVTMTALTTLNLTGNKLETIDLSGFSTIKTLNLPNNNLTEVKLPATSPAKTYMYLQNNKLKFSTIPAQPENVTRYTLVPQQAVEIAVADGKVDLASEAMVGENATIYTWYAPAATADEAPVALVEGTDYTVENGVFSFLKSQTGVYCEMANAAFPTFTGANILKTTAVDVNVEPSGIEGIAVDANAVPAVYYNLQGVEVVNPANGLYIVKRGNKVTKELVK